MNKAGAGQDKWIFQIQALFIHNFNTNAYNLHAVENSNILKWNERLNIAVDVAQGIVYGNTFRFFFLH
jgi:hypothetical protein